MKAVEGPVRWILEFIFKRVLFDATVLVAIVEYGFDYVEEHS